MMYRNTFRFIDELENMVHSINMSPHASLLNIAPAEFKADRDLYRVWATYHLKHLRKLPMGLGGNINFKFRLGQSVRISRLRTGLSKAYDGTFSNEVFQIIARRHTRPPSYELKDIKNSVVEGQFYEPELIAANDREDQEYMVNNVIRRFTDPKTKKRMAIVNWRGWPTNHISEIPEEHIVVTSGALKSFDSGTTANVRNDHSSTALANNSPFAPPRSTPAPTRTSEAARPSTSVAAQSSPTAHRPRARVQQRSEGARAPSIGMTLRPRHGRL